MEDRQGTAARGRAEELLAKASEYFQACLWDTASGEAAREVMIDERGLTEKTLRAFGVGFAPVGANEQLKHLRDLGYSDEELEAAGLASRSPRGRIHAHFHSRVMFPVTDRKGHTIGFAGLGTHVGPSWALWVSSPDSALYDRAAAVFGIDRAAKKIRSSREAVVLRDCVEVLLAHQEGRTNAVTVHTGGVTSQQQAEMASGLPGGVKSLKLDLAPGMTVEPEPDRVAAAAEQTALSRRLDAPRAAGDEPRFFELKKLGLVSATAVAAMNTWTGAPLLAVWLGSKAQGGQVLSARGVVIVLVVMSVLVFALAWVLLWLSTRYDKLTGRPAIAGQTSPWHRAKRGDRVQDIRSRYGVSAPEKIVIGCVVAAVLALEVWFFLYAGAPF
jgi:hypothetical protein